MIRVVLALCLAVATPAAAYQSQSGDWSAVKLGNRCLVYTLRAAPDTSGTLIFSFERGGYNASFTYEYTPWPGETEPPWTDDDFVLLEVDAAENWLGEEMFPLMGPGGDSLSMTGGFVPEMIATLSEAQRSVGISMERTALGEVWLYGLFSTAGFGDSMSAAAEWCAFDPYALPQS